MVTAGTRIYFSNNIHVSLLNKSSYLISCLILLNNNTLGISSRYRKGDYNKLLVITRYSSPQRPPPPQMPAKLSKEKPFLENLD